MDRSPLERGAERRTVVDRVACVLPRAGFVGAFAGGGVVLNGGLYGGPTGNAGAVGAMPVPGADGRRMSNTTSSSLFLSAQNVDQLLLSGAFSRLVRRPLRHAPCRALRWRDTR